MADDIPIICLSDDDHEEEEVFEFSDDIIECFPSQPILSEQATQLYEVVNIEPKPKIIQSNNFNDDVICIEPIYPKEQENRQEPFVVFPVNNNNNTTTTTTHATSDKKTVSSIHSDRNSPKLVYYQNIDYESIVLPPSSRPKPQPYNPPPPTPTKALPPKPDYQRHRDPPQVYSSTSRYEQSHATNNWSTNDYQQSNQRSAASSFSVTSAAPHVSENKNQQHQHHHTNDNGFVAQGATHSPPNSYSGPAADTGMSYVGIDGDASQKNNGDDLDLKRSDFAHSKKLEATFARYFKFKGFRKNQFEAINAACLGYDCLILMPTGGGKSICYQLPALVGNGVTIVVSPLKSLIEDQVNKLVSLNIKASALSSETSSQEQDSIYYDLRSSQPLHKMLYVTPEKLSKSGLMLNILKQLYQSGKLDRFVIDEAHCVSQWGFDFRPDYNKLGVLRDEFPRVPIMALTATAPPKVRLDIMSQLRIRPDKSKVFIQSFNRPNIKFEVRKKAGKNLSTSDIIELIFTKFKDQSGIIYCLSRNDCEKVAAELRENGIKSVPYHAGLDPTKRRNVQNGWDSNKCKVICATIAFGMGIDKPDVRFVIHYSVPKSIEGYYQEAGRAGRDGQFAHCILYYSGSDIQRMKHMLGRSHSARSVNGQSLDELNLHQIASYCQNTSECRRAYLLRYLGENFDTTNCLANRATACDNCLKAENKKNSLHGMEDDVWTGPSLGERAQKAKQKALQDKSSRIYTNQMRLANGSDPLPPPSAYRSAFLNSYDDTNIMDDDSPGPSAKRGRRPTRKAGVRATAKNKAMAKSADWGSSPSSSAKKYNNKSPRRSEVGSRYFAKRQAYSKKFANGSSPSTSTFQNYEPLGPTIARTSTKRATTATDAASKKMKSEFTPTLGRVDWTAFPDLPPF